jgi:hypothetical protein
MIITISMTVVEQCLLVLVASGIIGCILGIVSTVHYGRTNKYLIAAWCFGTAFITWLVFGPVVFKLVS